MPRPIKGKEFEPTAINPTPGALDLCFISTLHLEEAIGRLQECQWPIIEGPVMRTGAMGRIRWGCIRDPDGNLIEISELIKD
jgi:hypothetical protein